MSSLLVSRVLEFASIRATGISLFTEWTSMSRLSADTLGFTFGAPGIGVDVTAFGLLSTCFGVPEVLGLGVPLASAARAPGESHRDFVLPLLEFDCRFWSLLSSGIFEVPGFGDPWGFPFWPFLSLFGIVAIFDVPGFGDPWGFPLWAFLSLFDSGSCDLYPKACLSIIFWVSLSW